MAAYDRHYKGLVNGPLGHDAAERAKRVDGLVAELQRLSQPS